jgi:hypothetical protein
VHPTIMSVDAADQSPTTVTFERTLRGARRAARARRTDEWVHEFLSAGPGANPYMAVGLRKQQRWWIGPLLVPVSSLVRICGPEPEMEYRTSQQAWEIHVAEIMTVETEALPPIILEFRGSASLRLSDGNHRHEATRRNGVDGIWALIWCNTEADFLAAKRIYKPGRRARARR